MGDYARVSAERRTECRRREQRRTPSLDFGIGVTEVGKSPLLAQERTLRLPSLLIGCHRNYCSGILSPEVVRFLMAKAGCRRLSDGPPALGAPTINNGQ